MQLPDLPNQLDHSRLQGQSPYVINAGWYMQNDSATLQASLLYNVFGPRVFAIGSAFYASTAELPFHSLDALGSWRFTKRCTAQFGVQNLLNEQVRMVLDINRDGHFNTSDALVKRYRPGTCVTAGIRVQLSH